MSRTVIKTKSDALYEITVSNPEGVERGVRRVVVDGRQIKGNVLPIVRAGATVRVEVEMGEG